MTQTAVDWLIDMLVTENEVTLKGENYKLFEIAKQMEKEQIIETWSLGYNSGWNNCMKKFKQEEQQAKEIEKQQKKDTKTMEKLIESNRKFDEKNNNSIKYNPNDRSEDNPNVTNFFI
jgi:hypothetical protein